MPGLLLNIAVTRNLQTRSRLAKPETRQAVQQGRCARQQCCSQHSTFGPRQVSPTVCSLVVSFFVPLLLASSFRLRYDSVLAEVQSVICYFTQFRVVIYSSSVIRTIHRGVITPHSAHQSVGQLMSISSSSPRPWYILSMSACSGKMCLSVVWLPIFDNSRHWSRCVRLYPWAFSDHVQMWWEMVRSVGMIAGGEESV